MPTLVASSGMVIKADRSGGGVILTFVNSVNGIFKASFTTTESRRLRALLQEAEPQTRPRCGATRFSLTNGIHTACRRFVRTVGDHCHDHQNGDTA